MSEGYIYVLSNKYLVGLLKIGYTERSIKKRVQELSSSTSIPTPFKCVYWVKVREPERNEELVHRSLAKKNVGKEFFKLKDAEARDLILGIVTESFICEKRLQKTPGPLEPRDGVIPQKPSPWFIKKARDLIDQMDLSTKDALSCQIREAKRKFSELRKLYSRRQTRWSEVLLWHAVHYELRRLKEEKFPSPHHEEVVRPVVSPPKDRVTKQRYGDELQEMRSRIQSKQEEIEKTCSSDKKKQLRRELNDLIAEARMKFPDEKWS